MLKLELSNFVHRDDIKSCQRDEKLPQKVRGYSHMTHLQFSAPKISLEQLKLQTLNFVYRKLSD